MIQPVASEKGGGLNIGETLRVSLDSLAANRVRSFLTMLGVIIGVASVVSLMTLGNGASNAITSQVASIGTNSLTIFATSPASRGPGGGGAVVTPLDMSSVAAIEALRLPIVGPVPQFTSASTVVAPAANTNANIVGTTATFQEVQSVVMDVGTFITDDHVRSVAQVVVLGAELKQDLFGDGVAIGETVRIAGKSLRVIGVMELKGGGGFGSLDDQAYVPISLAQQRLFSARTSNGQLRVNTITVSVVDAKNIDFVQERIEMALRDQRKINEGDQNDFSVINQAAFLSTLTFLAAIAGISLLVGGIGIMNIMLVSVTERTREIGLRRAVGAQSRDILLQFMIEATVLSLFGGIIGVLVGSILPIVLTAMGTLDAPITADSVIISLTVAIATGLFFGIWPARRAANLNPIEALRHE
jgi:putative ABC transport system permease protein